MGNDARLHFVESSEIATLREVGNLAENGRPVTFIVIWEALERDECDEFTIRELRRQAQLRGAPPFEASGFDDASWRGGRHREECGDDGEDLGLRVRTIDDARDSVDRPHEPESRAECDRQSP